ncbi:MAG: F0F1 ATP synthase subunit epsilon [Rhodospirillaceae bacterium]|jgi:F-type H+-transporting ATPase subunit epsilon|nr:F0F1 ATP synthase subunit epsilon [Rhodospirillaceae bacterium]MBT6118888.1 F0F1 ATP synthase subunit epsilon [Rhodospirillaceae bacterium]
MADDKVEFELVSPEKLLLSEAVDMVVVPGTEGNFGVLPGHAPFISTVRMDVIETYEGREVRDRIFVAGGFAEVTPQRCTVLAEVAVPLADIDRAEVETEIRGLEEELRDSSDPDEKILFQNRLDVAHAKLDVLAQQA